MPSELIPEFTAPEELKRDVMTVREIARGIGRRIASDWGSQKHVLLTALIAGIVARYLGRPRAKFENTIIGGIAAGFSAYRDPRDALWKQLLVAVGYGATWGLTDVYVPKLLNYFSQAGEMPIGDEPGEPERSTLFEPAPEPAIANGAEPVATGNGAGNGEAVAGWRPPRRGRARWR
jgi:hypothetical protein